MMISGPWWEFFGRTKATDGTLFMTDERRLKIQQLLDNHMDQWFMETISHWDRIVWFDEAHQWLMAENLTGKRLHKWLLDIHRGARISSFQTILMAHFNEAKPRIIRAGIEYWT